MQKRKNKGKPRLTKAMLMPVAMQALVRVIEHGEEKYGPASDKGWHDYEPQEVLDSLSRHMVALINGQQNDPDSGLPHAVAIMFNAAVYAELTIEDDYFEEKENDAARNVPSVGRGRAIIDPDREAS